MTDSINNMVVCECTCAIFIVDNICQTCYKPLKQMSINSQLNKRLSIEEAELRTTWLYLRDYERSHYQQLADTMRENERLYSILSDIVHYKGWLDMEVRAMAEAGLPKGYTYERGQSSKI